MTRPMAPKLARVLLLADGTRTATEIADALGMTPRAVSNATYRLRLLGLPAQTTRKQSSATRAKTSAAKLPACLPAEKRDDYRLLKRAGYRRDEALRALGIIPHPGAPT
jgi:hypothetical protein